MENNMSFRAKATLGFYRTLHLVASVAAIGITPVLSRYSRRVKEGFNDYLGNVQCPVAAKKPVLWVHGVSMGESMVALGFAKELKKLYPESTLVFTTTHPDVIKDVKKKNIADAVAYFPLDNYRSMCRIFNRWQPDAIFVAETDFWPEFSQQCRVRNVPLFLINGRISSKIESFYKKARGAAEIVFGAFTAFAVQSRVDADRLVNIGVSESKIHVLGNMKADFTHTTQVNLTPVEHWLNSPKSPLLNEGNGEDVANSDRGGQRPSVVFGSLHPEEFTALKPLFKKLVADNIAVIIAPRNITLAESWAADLAREGISVCRKTQISDSDIMILDTIGELASVYRLSTISFVGGSMDYNKTGGHNPLEVLQQNVPLLMGQYYRNFTDIVEQLKECGGIEIITDAAQGYEVINKILTGSSKYTSMVTAGTKVLTSNKGVVSKTLDLVCSKINEG